VKLISGLPLCGEAGRAENHRLTGRARTKPLDHGSSS
jgi:hypothetical protein